MSTTQDQLLRFFREAAGTDVAGTPDASQLAESGGGPLADATSSVALGPASDVAGGQIYAATPVGTSTEGGAESAAQSTGGTGSTIESALTTFLEGGLGIVPLVSGLMGLFGGGNSAAPNSRSTSSPLPSTLSVRIRRTDWWRRTTISWECHGWPIRHCRPRLQRVPPEPTALQRRRMGATPGRAYRRRRR